MKALLVLLCCGVCLTAAQCATTTAIPATGAHQESNCSCTVPNIWLDIVLVVDVSGSMTTDGLAQVQSTLSTALGELTVAQSLGQTSRVALVSFADTATVVAELTDYTSIDNVLDGIYSIQYSGSVKVNLIAGLKAAQSVIHDAKAPPNRKTVVLVYTSSYSSAGFGSPEPIARQIKEDGGKLMTVAFIQETTGSDVAKILNIASSGYGFMSNATDVIGDVQRAFCQANCFCKNNWIQYSQHFNTTDADAAGWVYGECLRFDDLPSNWYSANRSCSQKMGAGAYLATEYSAHKNKFDNDYARSVWNTQGTPNYYVGLNYISALKAYAWQQPNGQPPSQLEPNDYTNWAPGYPNNAGRKDVVKVVQKGFSAKWYNDDKLGGKSRYICQVHACDTDHYCDSVE